jgi:SAM-dependent methyltransferase
MEERNDYTASLSDTRSSYDSVAEEYAAHFSNELEHKPLDRELLNRFAREVEGKGTVCDLGCGPGHLAGYLRARGLRDVIGLDLSPGMLEQARRLNPDIEFLQGDMRALDLPDGSLAGIAAFYSIIHNPKDGVTAVLRELRRVLKPGGVLLLAFHKGEQVIHRDELLGKPVTLDFAFFMPEEMRAWLEEAGFSVEEVIEREPYAEVEHPSQRVYIWSRKPLTGDRGSRVGGQ